LFFIFAPKQETSRWLNNRAENSHLSLRRQERAMQRFRSMRCLHGFAAVQSSVGNHFNQKRHRYSQDNFKLKRTAALSERRQLSSA
jgi:putative transposase